MANTVPSGVPVPNSQIGQFIDTESGKLVLVDISSQLYRFLVALWNRTGSGVGVNVTVLNAQVMTNTADIATNTAEIQELLSDPTGVEGLFEAPQVDQRSQSALLMMALS